MPISVDSLRTFISQLLVSKSLFQFDADIVADRLIDAELYGHAEFGLQLLPDCLESLDAGDIDPRARILEISTAPAAVVLNGSDGVGLAAATRTMERAVELARTNGVGLALVRNCLHFGWLGSYALIAADEGMLGVAIGNPAGPSLAPDGTNGSPIAPNTKIGLALSAADNRPLVVTTQAASTSAGVAAELGTSIGLPLFAALLTGPLTGVSVAEDGSQEAQTVGRQCACLAIDPALLVDVQKFSDRVGEAAQRWAVELPNGATHVQLNPHESVAQARERGVELSETTRTKLEDWASRSRVEIPW